MSKPLRLIQNAVRVKSTGTIYKSSHVWDCVWFDVGDHRYMIDGGLEYVRTNIDPTNTEIEWLTLYENATQEKIFNNLVWGTYGPEGKDPLKYVLLKDCSTEHLNKILDIPNLCPIIEKTILSILLGRRIEERLAKL